MTDQVEAPSPEDTWVGDRVGEFADRLGVTTHALRAWERRYGLLQPRRSVGGYRLYGVDDERRVRELLALRAAGMSTSDAAERVLAHERAEPLDDDAGPLTDDAGPFTDDAGRFTDDAGPFTDDAGPFTDGAGPFKGDSSQRVHREALLNAVDRFDEAAANAAVDKAMLSLSFDAALGGVLLPALRELGEQWEAGEPAVAREHFASHLIRRRLGAFTLTWGGGRGPRAILACPPGELHDVALICFGLMLRRSGWRISYLGQDTPIDAIEQAAAVGRVDAVVLAATRAGILEPVRESLAVLGERHPLVLAGPAVTDALAKDVNAVRLPFDPATSAYQLTVLRRRGPIGPQVDAAATESAPAPAEPSTPEPDHHPTVRRR